MCFWFDLRSNQRFQENNVYVYCWIKKSKMPNIRSNNPEPKLLPETYSPNWFQLHMPNPFTLTSSLYKLTPTYQNCGISFPHLQLTQLILPNILFPPSRVKPAIQQALWVLDPYQQRAQVPYHFDIWKYNGMFI